MAAPNEPQQPSHSPVDESDDEYTVHEPSERRHHGPVRSLVRSLPILKHISRRVWFFLGTLVLVALVFASISGAIGQLSGALRSAIAERELPVWPRFSLAAEPVGPSLPGTWEDISLPVPAKSVLGFTAATNDPSTAYLCARTPGEQTESSSPMVVWATHTGGASWQSVTQSVVSGTGCAMSIAPDQSRRVAMVVRMETGCPASAVLLSNDAGASWRTLPTLPSHPAGTTRCDESVSLTAQSVFLLDIPFFPDAQNDLGFSHIVSLARSDDDGKHWRIVSDKLPANPAVGPPAWMVDAWPEDFLARGQTTLLGVRYNHCTGGATTCTQLWMTHDDWRDWQLEGVMNGYSAETFVDSAQTSFVHPSLDHPLYALYADGGPAAFFVLQTAEIAGGRWALVPPLPLAGTSASRTGLFQALGEMPTGELLALGAPDSGALAAQAQSRSSTLQHAPALWLWSPQSSRWSRFAAPMPSLSAKCVTDCWRSVLSVGGGQQGAGVYLWLWSPLATDAHPLRRIRLARA